MADFDARDELRVSGWGLLRCPSCGELAAELLGRHNLLYGTETTCPYCRHPDEAHDYTAPDYRDLPCSRCPGGRCRMPGKGELPHRKTFWAECRDGRKVILDDYDTIKAATSIAFADRIWFTENQAYAKMGLPLWNWKG